jgi:hypothetical protein
MSTLDGSVISMCDDRHRHQEWLTFLRGIDDLTPTDKQLHLIAETTPRTSTPRCRSGWPAIRASTCSSLQPAVPGSTW